MKKILLIIIGFSVTLTVFGQKQQGYVKTKGRMNSDGTVIAGTRIPGVSIVTRGGNSTMSDSRGEFAFTVSSNTYSLVAIKKQGYVLLDPDVLFKQYAYSKNPLVLVMESPNQQANDKLAAERRIRKALQRQLQDKEYEIEALKEQHKLSEEEYQKQLQGIYAHQESNEKLIREMADRYSRMDFDVVDDFNRRIGQLIFEGKLSEADSLLNTKGDIRIRTAQLRHHQEANLQAEQDIKKKQKKLEKSKLLVQKELESLAQDCYTKFEIFKMLHQNDSAAYYIELRAGLDTTNIKNQLDACSFLSNYMSSFEEALSYGYRAMRHSKENMSADTLSYISSLLSIASVYYKKHEYKISVEVYEKAIEMLENTDISTELLCTAYNNIGVIYKAQAFYSKALDYFQKSKALKIVFYGEDNPSLVATYNNIGDISLLLKNDCDTALSYYEKALTIIEKDSSDLAKTYLNIGKVYAKKKEYDNAMNCYQKALNIQKSIYGVCHPAVAICYESIGILQYRNKEYENSIEYMKKGLTVRHKIHGETDSDVAMSYTMIAKNYQELHYLDSALIYNEKALDIQKNIYGEKHPYTAFNVLTLASCYKEKGNSEKALKYAEMALSTFKETLGVNHPYVATTLKFIGDIKKEQELYSDALVFYKEAKVVFSNVLGADNPKTLKVIQCIEEISKK